MKIISDNNPLLLNGTSSFEIKFQLGDMFVDENENYFQLRIIWGADFWFKTPLSDNILIKDFMNDINMKKYRWAGPLPNGTVYKYESGLDFDKLKNEKKQML